MDFALLVVQLVALWLVLVLAIPVTLRNHAKSGGMKIMVIIVPPLLWVCAFRQVARWATDWRSASWVVGTVLAFYTFSLLSGIAFALPRDHSLLVTLTGSFLPTLVAAVVLLFSNGNSSPKESLGTDPV